MIKFAGVAAAACLAIAATTPFAWAIPDHPKPRVDRLCPEVANLSAYVAFRGEFEPLDICPPIVFSPTAPGAQGLKQDRGAARVLGATYYPETGTILLSARTNVHSIEGMAQLVHELVHVYQYTHGLHQDVACKEALEPQAFAIQIAFLTDNGYDAEAAELTRRAAIRGHCPKRRRQLN